MHKREAERGEVMIPKRRALGPYATNKLANQANIQSGKQKLPKPSLLRADSDSSTGSAPALMPTGRRSSIGVVKSSKRRTSLEQNLGATMSKIEEAYSVYFSAGKNLIDRSMPLAWKQLLFSSKAPLILHRLAYPIQMATGSNHKFYLEEFLLNEN